MLPIFSIRREISRTTRYFLACLSWLLLIGAWYAVTKAKLLPPLSFPSPVGVVQAFRRLWLEYDLLGNVLQSWWRIAQAFLFSALIAIPLGLLMASFRWLDGLIQPISAPMRSMPITAFLPAFLGLFGLDEFMKVSFLWFGMFFYLLALVTEEVNRVDNCYLETAYTLGAKRRHILSLLFHASLPNIFSSFRILYDIGWTYVILAEMVNARKGVGYMVEAARKVLDFERVYAGIIAIGIAAFLFRQLLSLAEHALFPWRKVLESSGENQSR